MRTAATGVGSPADVINGLVVRLKACEDLRELEHR
jgi:hypothetical protein